MPRVTSDAVYEAVHEAVGTVIMQHPELINAMTIRMEQGTGVYRYVSFRDQMPQMEDAARQVWQNLNRDLSNRWTGRGTEDGEGMQGLYLTAESQGAEDTHFVELEHYQRTQVTDPQMLDYLQYQAGLDPQPEHVEARELRSLFLFTLQEEQVGLDLRLDGAGREFLQMVWEEATANAPEAFEEANIASLEEAYMHLDSASFDRAVGNGVLEFTDVDYFQTQSVRADEDHPSDNIVMRAETQTPLDVLEAQGRITFYLDEDGQTHAVYSDADLMYNVNFDEAFDAYPDMEQHDDEDGDESGADDDDEDGGGDGDILDAGGDGDGSHVIHTGTDHSSDGSDPGNGNGDDGGVSGDPTDSSDDGDDRDGSDFDGDVVDAGGY